MDNNLESDLNEKSRRDALIKRNQGRVCKTPFVRVDIWRDGSVPVCCTDWMQGDVIIGNIFKDDINDIWNSETAKRIRKSVTDGSFSHCTEKCPWLAAGTLPLKEELPERQRFIADNPTLDLEHSPLFIKLVNDDSCNLSCPSCRHDVFVESQDRSEEIFEANMRVVYPMLKNAEVLDILGNGEALTSKATMKLLGTLDAKTHAGLTIDLLTNGILFNDKAWDRLRNLHPLNIRLNVSTDGITKQSFEKLRRGGRWEVFIKNLSFIAKLRNENKISMLTLNFTIQSANYKELPLISGFTRKYNADRAFIFRYNRWPHMSDAHYIQANIFDENHPLHDDFVSTINKVSDPIIELGPLSIFIK